GKGRFLLLADHSIFINTMMLAEDNNNVEFAVNCLTWLEYGNKDLSQVLFVEDGRVKSSLDVPLKPVDIDVNRVLVHVGDRLVELGEQDAYNRALLERISPDFERANRRVYKVILLGLTLIAALYLTYRVGVRARYSPEPALPRLERAVLQHTPGRALLEQR